MARTDTLPDWQPVARSLDAGPITDDSTDADLWVAVDGDEYRFATSWDDSGRTRSLAQIELVEPAPQHVPLARPDETTDTVPAAVVDALEGATYHYPRPDARCDGPQQRRHVVATAVHYGRHVALLDGGDGVVVLLRHLLHDAATGDVEVETLRERA